MSSLTALLPTPSSLLPDPLDPAASEEEYYSSWSLFLVCILLLLSLLTSYHLQHNRIRILMVHETLVSIVAGTVVGLIVRLAPGTMIREMLSFRHTVFFNLLLPPIILNSGYELRQREFFRNFGTILTFAFLGTFISAVGVGVLTFIYSSLSLDTPPLSLIECLTFGSTLSATDPVTILAIFNQYKVDPKLYTIIFGESLLNDAVSIVMYDTLSQLHSLHGPGGLGVSSLVHGTGLFLLSFFTSLALGILFGLSTSLTLKHTQLRLYPALETSVISLSAYTCYFFSNGMGQSGIVSLLFCGITLKHYAVHTMSRRTRRSTRYIFETLAKISEGFIFVYLGLGLFTSPPSGGTPVPSGASLGSLSIPNSQLSLHQIATTIASTPTPTPILNGIFTSIKPLFILITLCSVVFTRYAAVFPLASLINWGHAWRWRRVNGVSGVNGVGRGSSLHGSTLNGTHSNVGAHGDIGSEGRGTGDMGNIDRPLEPPKELPEAYQTLLFWAGLRGAVGVALAAGFKGFFFLFSTCFFGPQPDADTQTRRSQTCQLSI
ncbi:Sodium/hydrogen exchanger family-domain-containing protein [Crepidotus variabilis]|uniref:Sodium/hydrogen exchanger n=1 Tax=Crepidotus variabilis TaxID=179855 RepID=A0A9P6EHX3_9AGAR|nr:Sodium/hydrogen exchanger family-domain-containing protein [Crepidotus variabilis]